MARPQSVAGGRPHTVTVRLSQAEKRRLDALRGPLKAPEFFRQLLNGRSASSAITDREG